MKKKKKKKRKLFTTMILCHILEKPNQVFVISSGLN